MLANALTCPNLENMTETYKGMTFYLDTPLLVHRLGLEGEPKQTAIEELIDLLAKLGARVAVFSHSLAELQSVVRGAANYLDSSVGRGAIVYEARKNNTTRSDLFLVAESIEDQLTTSKIEIISTPDYILDYQIDESIFEEFMDDDDLFYYNPRAKEHDINSVRSIYVLRKDRHILSLEKSIAILVTSNTAFARAAWRYGKQHEPSQEVSSVISDFSLANMAWLKAPMGASSLPTNRVLAFCYAAMEPSNALINKYMAEIERLKQSGQFSEREHQLLRSSPYIVQELMHSTLGDDEAITSESLGQVLESVTNEIKKEESERLAQEQQSHKVTQTELTTQQYKYHEQLEYNRNLLDSIYWKCVKQSKRFAQSIYTTFAVLLSVTICIGVILEISDTFTTTWPLTVIPALLGAVSFISYLTGGSLRNIRNWIQNRNLAWRVKREAKNLGIDIEQNSLSFYKEGLNDNPA